jgi:flagellar basal body-associated protein FliL
MRKKMRLIAILSAMILSAGTMSVPALANTGENAGDGSTQAATVQTQETDSQDKDNSAAGTTQKPAESDAANPIEDITGTKQPEGTIDRSVTITDDTGSELTIPVSNVEMLLTLMEKLQGKGDGKQTGTVTTNGDVLNVRTGSSTDYDIIDQLRNGSIVEVLGEENGWYKIRIPDSTGFVCGDYLSVSTAQEELISRDDLKNLLEMVMSQEGAGKSLALTPEGNLTLVDDVGKTTGAGKQFVTMVTKNGNYFYLVIDRDDKGESTVHFLNQVDERDLFSLMDEDEAAAMKEELAAEEAAKQAAENPPAATPSETETEVQEPEKKPAGSMLPALIVLILVLGGGGAFFFLQLTKKKKAEAVRPDPDADYEEEDDSDFDYPMNDEDTGSEETGEDDSDYYDESGDDEPV